MGIRRHRTGRRWISPLVLVVVAVVLAAIILPVAGVLALDVLTRVTAQLESAVNGEPAAATFAPEMSLLQFDRWQGAERVNVLVMGIDQRPGENPDQARTDTMLLLTLDPQAKTAGMLSIPRDLYVPLPGGGQDRINTAHVHGGPQMAMETVEYNFGLPVQHYVRVNFKALVTLIDLVGGIDIYVEQDIEDPTFPDDHYGFEPFTMKAGWHHMDGKTALKYARTRYGSSDFSRMQRQQQVALALREAVQNADLFTRLLPNASSLLMTLNDAIQTDLSGVELAQLAVLAKDIPPERIARVAVDETAVQEWTTPQGASVLVPIRTRIMDLRKELYMTLPDSTATPAAGTPEPGTISIRNGTQTPGLAVAAKAYLESKGYTVVDVDNAPQAYEKSVIFDYRGRQTFTAQLAEVLALPPSSVSLLLASASPVDALVILGDDFDLPEPAPAQNTATP